MAARPFRPTVVVDLHLVLMRDRHVLLGLRQATGYCDGMYHLPAGHLEANETVLEGIVREAREELDILLQQADLRLDYVMHHRSNTDRMALFFSARHWIGEPKNSEPTKCKTLTWFAMDQLPGNIVPYAQIALLEMEEGKRLGFYGWPERGAAV